MASPHFRTPNEALTALMEQIEEKKKIVAKLEEKYADRLANPLPEPKLPKLAAFDNPENRERQLRAGEEIARITSDINCLKKVNPEAYPETGHEAIDDNIRFYLAVGDLQKSSEILRSHLELSEKSLKSMEEEAQVTKNLISEYEELHKALVEAKTKAQKDKTREGADKDPTAVKAEELDKKIRSTNQVYKKIKGFLAEFLSEIAPASDDDSCLAKLLQELWNSFQENPENWVDLSSLEFDVDDQVIMQLVRYGFIDTCTDDSTKVRFVNFTE